MPDIRDNEQLEEHLATIHNSIISHVLVFPGPDAAYTVAKVCMTLSRVSCGPSSSLEQVANV